MKGVQLSYALLNYERNTSDRFAVNRVEIPGNGQLVDAGFGKKPNVFRGPEPS